MPHPPAHRFRPTSACAEPVDAATAAPDWPAGSSPAILGQSKVEADAEVFSEAEAGPEVYLQAAPDLNGDGNGDGDRERDGGVDEDGYGNEDEIPGDGNAAVVAMTLGPQDVAGEEGGAGGDDEHVPSLPHRAHRAMYTLSAPPVEFRV